MKIHIWPRLIDLYQLHITNRWQSVCPSVIGAVTPTATREELVQTGWRQSIVALASMFDVATLAGVCLLMSLSCYKTASAQIDLTSAHERSITIDHSRVSASDQTDFPVLVSGNYSFLATTANGGEVFNSNGYDIIFTSDAAGQHPLSFEIDTYDPTSGTASFWVKVPTLSHTTDTVIYMFDGISGITTSQEDKTGLWSNSFLSVYHLGNGSTVGTSDSGSAGYLLYGSAAATSGLIGGGAAFTDTTTYLYHDSVTSYPSGQSAVTLEGWVKQAAPQSTDFAGGEILGYGENTGTGSRVTFTISGDSLGFDFEFDYIQSPLTYDNNWHHIVAVYGGGELSTTADQMYVDGVALTESSSGGTPNFTTAEFKIGGVPTWPNCCAFNGSVDEVRISSGTRSAGWVATEYANQSSPSSFYSLGSAKATPVISWSAPASISYGTGLSATQLDATSSVAGTFAYAPALGAVLQPGINTLSVTFTPNDTADYTSATSSVALSVTQATSTISWSTPVSIPYGTALSSTQLNASASVPGTFAYSPTAGSVPAIGSTTLSVTFTPTDTTHYTGGTASVSLSVTQATPVVSWSTPADITYGAALSSTQLNAFSSVPGTFAYSPAAGTVPALGAEMLSVTFTPTDTTHYTTATASVPLTVTGAIPVLTWPTPAAVPYGTKLDSTVLNAAAAIGGGSLAGTYTYTPAADTVPALGTTTLTVLFTPYDTTHYSTATASVSLTVIPMTTESAMWSDNSPSSSGSVVDLSVSITSDWLIPNGTTSPTLPGGTVTFYDGSTLLGTETVNQISSVYNYLYGSEVIADDASANLWNMFDPSGSSHVIQTESASAPSGSETATTVTAEGPSYTNVYETVSLIVNDAYTRGSFTSSIWLRADDPTTCSGVQLGIYGPYTLEGSYSTPAVGNTWQRFSATGTIQYDDQGQIVVSIPAGCTLSMWGAQLENNANMGAYQYENEDGFYPEFSNGTSAVSTATYSTSALSDGIHQISAVYSGDAYNGPSTAYFTQYVGVDDTVSMFDTGNVTLTVNGVSATTAYGQNSTAYTIAQGLSAAFAALPSPPVTVSSFENSLAIVATQSGAGTNYPYTFTITHDSVNFSSPSYTVSTASGTLAGGATAGQNLTPIYSYSVLSGGYDLNGNVLSYTDTVMGSWSFGYDQLNRLVTAANTAGPPASTPAVPTPSWSSNFCWAYDSFGNRLQQANANAAFTSGVSSGSGTCATSGTLYQNVLASYSSQNQLTQTNAPGYTETPVYDPAGDVIDDGRNQYLYDAEGRICAVWTTGSQTGIGYMYDAVGNRVAKGNIHEVNVYTGSGFQYQMTCDVTANGFTQTAGYVVGPAGEQMTEISSTNQWLHTNVWAAGRLIATYVLGDPAPHFHIDDPLGSRRAQANSAGALEAVYQSLPFGDGFAQGGSLPDPTENHFTGKERDTESGNDYFMARYYNSPTGRFLSPDWSARYEPVPYAKLDTPQSLNLYGYMLNNPLGGADPDGHNAFTSWVSNAWNKTTAAVSKFFGGSESSISITQGEGKTVEWEPNDAAALGGDAEGLVAATPGVISGDFGLAVGLAATAGSIENDSSNLNVGINGVGQVLAGVSALAEGTAVGAGATGSGFGLAIGATAWDSANALTNHVLVPMANAAPTQTINVGNQMIPNPALADESPDTTR